MDIHVNYEVIYGFSIFLMIICVAIIWNARDVLKNIGSERDDL